MTRVASVLAALALLATGCAGTEGADQSVQAARSPQVASDSALTTDPGVDVGTGAAVEVDVDDDGSGFDLSFVIDQRPPTVIVGAVTGASITAYERPDATSPALTELTNPNAVGGPLVFQLVAPDVTGDEWAEVLLPIRPNGITGWVRTAELELSSNPYRVEIDIDRHQLQVLKANEPWMTTTVAIGTGATPTPIGRFYVTELLRPPSPDGPYGPFAFGLSGYSETLTNYAGGEGVIGIHGTDEPESIGADVSHGCVRLANHEIEALAAVLPLGTPVIIQP
jgi:hypothetical protein